MDDARGTVFNAGFPIYWWYGRSGRVYPHSVFPLSAVPCLPEANYILAAQAADGRYEPVYIDATENLMEALRANPAVFQALEAGATHIHIHLLGESPRRRLEICQDLREGLRLPLGAVQAWLAAS